jgi:hypothetical protein
MKEHLPSFKITVNGFNNRNYIPRKQANRKKVSAMHANIERVQQTIMQTNMKYLGIILIVCSII